ncbi:DUF547 domain-containing protein [Flagellimonas sp.]|uniref:DUF547 domain-containing protein n=1 Tax=Flagellimonas sp. TaxID=2058762 RepID=UPI003B50C4A0
MNLILHVLLGMFLFSCDGKEKEQSQTAQKHADIAAITIGKETHSAKKAIIQLPDHTLWGSLLKMYVDDEGNVDYAGIKKEVDKLDNYLNHLAQNPPSGNWTKHEKLAYYINIYNAATVKLIVAHYPIQSIKDIPNRWKKKWIKVGDETTSLNDIEHEVLRKMDEPRIHFAINCASYSCPKLLNVPFTAKSMERLLSKTAVDFVNDKTRNRFGNGTAQLSRIFKWYKDDFTEKGKLLDYINQYLENPVGKDAKVEFLDYDWSLNEAK